MTRFVEDPEIRSQAFVCISTATAWSLLDAQLEGAICMALEDQGAGKTFRAYVRKFRGKIMEAMSRQGYLGAYEHMIKVRGIFPTAEAAAEHAKHLDKTIGPTEPVSIYSIETGKWCPADVAKGHLVNYTMYRARENFKLETNAFNVKMAAHENVTAMSSRPTEEPEVYNADVEYCQKGPSPDGQNYVCVSIAAPSAENAEGYHRIAVGNFIHSVLRKQHGDKILDDEKVPEFDLTPDGVYAEFVEKYGPFTAMENTVPLFLVHGAFPDAEQAGAFCAAVHGQDIFDMFITRTGFWTSLTQDAENTTYKEEYMNEFHNDRRKMQQAAQDNAAFIANEFDMTGPRDSRHRVRGSEDTRADSAKKVHV
jgi:hypothetical protein